MQIGNLAHPPTPEQEDEVTGVDLTQHAETAYDWIGGIHLGHTASPAPASTEVPGREPESITG